MKICGVYDYEQNERGYICEIYGDMSMSIDDLFEYLRDNTYKNMILIAWLPSIKEIQIDYDRLDIKFNTDERATLYDRDVADYLIECIEKHTRR